MQDAQESPAVRHAVAQSLARIAVNENANLSILNTVVANQFFDGQVSVLPEAVGGTNLFWKSEK